MGKKSSLGYYLVEFYAARECPEKARLCYQQT